MYLNLFFLICYFFIFSVFPPILAQAGIEGQISGIVLNPSEAPEAGVLIKLRRLGAAPHTKQKLTDEKGVFEFFPLDAGDYELETESSIWPILHERVDVLTGTRSDVILRLMPPSVTPSVPAESENPAMVVQIKSKKKLIQAARSTTQSQISQNEIEALPMGSEASLPKLITSTSAGAVPGALGKIYFRGNHGSIQYQIDGVQLPDTPNSSFAQSFSPRNIDRMEVITGGIPAEYGLRLAAVVNILTKSGPEQAGGEVQLNYGSYETFSPHVLYGGTNEAGTLNYFFSFNYNQTQRAFDTPQPVLSPSLNQRLGGEESVHNFGQGHGEFVKLDWNPSPQDRFTLTAFNDWSTKQIPNYPTSFLPTNPLFQPDFQTPFVGHYHDGVPTFKYTPPKTNDYQTEQTSYIQAAWRRIFSERSFLLISPYYRYSYQLAKNDPTNDLWTTPGGGFPISGSTATSTGLNRAVNSIGLKSDYSCRWNNENLFKTGVQLQSSFANGVVSIQEGLNQAAEVLNSQDLALTESVYIQNETQVLKPLTMNLGLRFDSIQYRYWLSPKDSSNYDLFQPRVGLSYLLTENTQLRGYYGRLFQPAPLENFRVVFDRNKSAPSVYDIKPEESDFFELGLSQQLGSHVIGFSFYYKTGINFLDDAQLLDTRISQTFNYKFGRAYGAELSWKGQLSPYFFDYFNYSYSMARGQGRSGGSWAGHDHGDDPTQWIVLDHVQEHTANLGLTYMRNQFQSTVQALFGSGLRTGSDNVTSLPWHLTFDLSAGWDFQGKDFWTQWKASIDMTNVFNWAYPITIANEFNGTTYAAGRQIFLRLTKPL